MDDGNPIKNVLNRFLRSKPQKEGSSEEKVEEEIIQMVSEGHEQGVIDAQEAEMIHNIMEFDDKMADDVMTHRKNIMALDVDTPIQEAAVEMVNQPYSRYPVYEKDIDNTLIERTQVEYFLDIGIIDDMYGMVCDEMNLKDENGDIYEEHWMDSFVVYKIDGRWYVYLIY